MKTLMYILVTVGILAIVACADAILNTGNTITFLMVIGTSIWMAIDSKKISLKKYKSFISMGPVSVFLCGVIFWIITFPCYLSVRFRIKEGTAILKETKS
jgi:hypothetical protein